MLLKIYFKGDKYHLKIASDGKKAIEMLQNEEFDLVISDWNLSGSIDKTDLVDAIREIYPISSLPLIIMTADNGLNLSEQISSGTIQRVLHKPVLKKQLLAIVDQMLVPA